jgi:CRISPR-associated protein Cmr2
LHAFISRALGEFSHRVVPWVVECEFSGRLIYAGGDDVLALVSADEALDLAARLQQLYSAHWIIDTQHEEDAWFWRRSGRIDVHTLGQQLDGARARFVIPVPGPDEDRLSWPPVWQVPHTAHELHEVRIPVPNTMGPVLPMLGGNQSLSAGIVYANMKDPLGGLVRTAGRLLDELAKGRAGRAAVALADRSRNGEKRAFAMKWHQGAPPLSGVPGAHHLIRRLTQAFVHQQLPSRLPYKLREVARALEPIFDEWPDRILDPDPDQPRLLRNSIAANVDRDLDPAVLDAVEATWLAGWRLRSKSGKPTAEPVDHTLDGLLLALSLAEVER